ncbi:MAG: hypothetical protein A3F42_01390 [Gammaproteobacteria bacterium RIFCSPHIGHO2_12_FULL_37_34]|nr:MAG: hypothetical protein A3F42_01390 [Gammaproteobacteria bacterium RIFCSPHIGHO2_12_FULL_37_34]
MPNNTIAIIRESECIGCTKCIEVCPIDAILGTNKHMHTVIASECIGCELCIPPCPVDCIDLITQPATQTREARKALALKRITARKQRLTKKEHVIAEEQIKQSLVQKQNYIHAALARVRAKK